MVYVAAIRGLGRVVGGRFDRKEFTRQSFRGDVLYSTSIFDGWVMVV